MRQTFRCSPQSDTSDPSSGLSHDGQSPREDPVTEVGATGTEGPRRSTWWGSDDSDSVGSREGEGSGHVHGSRRLLRERGTTGCPW